MLKKLNFTVSDNVIKQWNELCKNNDRVTDKTTKSKVLLAISHGVKLENSLYACFDLRFVVKSGVVEYMYRTNPRVVINPTSTMFVSDRLRMNNNFDFVGFNADGKCNIKYGR